MRTVGFFTDGHGRAPPTLYLRPAPVPPGRACVPCPPGPCAVRSAGREGGPLMTGRRPGEAVTLAGRAERARAARASAAGCLVPGTARGRRGPRGRPRFGWASLTPAEQAVASLVADGAGQPADRRAAASPGSVEDRGDVGAVGKRDTPRCRAGGRATGGDAFAHCQAGTLAGSGCGWLAGRAAACQIRAASRTIAAANGSM